MRGALWLMVLCGCASTVAVSDGAAGDVVAADVVAPDVVAADVVVNDVVAADVVTPDVVTPDVVVNDVPMPRDGAIECRSAVDCDAMPAFPSVRVCTGGGRWSCIEGRCTRECNVSRTCAVDTAGCMVCSTGEPVCAGVACAVPGDLAALRVEDGMCARAFWREVDRCAGSFVRLRDGTWCTVDELPTGAIRYLLACGPCQTVLTP